MSASRGERWLPVVADLLGLASIAGLLVAIHLLVPPAIQEQFVFRQDLGRPETLVTAAFLHLDDAHLLGNLVGFAAAAGYAYLLCLFAGERRWFRLTTLSVLVLLPVLVNLSSLALWSVAYPGIDLPPSRGFSGVAAGFGGFLSIALLVSLRSRYSRRTVLNVGLFVLLALLSELLVIYADSPPHLGGALALVGMALAVEEIVRHGYPGGVPENRAGWVRLGADVVEVLVVLAVLSILVYGLFPAALVEDGAVTNVFAHLSGFVWGAVVSGWGYRYWKSDLNE